MLRERNGDTDPARIVIGKDTRPKVSRSVWTAPTAVPGISQSPCSMHWVQTPMDAHSFATRNFAHLYAVGGQATHENVTKMQRIIDLGQPSWGAELACHGFVTKLSGFTKEALTYESRVSEAV